MAFRYDESASDGLMHAMRLLVLSPGVAPSDRLSAEQGLYDLIDELGPVVSGYPVWHPIIPGASLKSNLHYPDARIGYLGLDHTIMFVSGFVTCPYGSGASVIDSVSNLRGHRTANITAEALEVPFYNAAVTPVVVKCDWKTPLSSNHMIPKSVAIPLMIEKAMEIWHHTEVGEPWNNVSAAMLGQPGGARSSLFVNQDTGLAMKHVYQAMLESGMYGPTYAG
jgi:hypothetical protein